MSHREHLPEAWPGQPHAGPAECTKLCRPYWPPVCVHVARRSSFGARLADLWAYDGGRRIPSLVSGLLRPLFPYGDPGLTEALKDDVRVLNVHAVHALNLPGGATPTSDLFRQLTPVPAIVNRVHAFWDRHLAGGPYVGVMLRAHPKAHKTTKATSPPEWFIRRMLQIREGAPDIRFFLSCDHEATQGRVSDGVPGSHVLLPASAEQSRSGRHALLPRAKSRRGGHGGCTRAGRWQSWGDQALRQPARARRVGPVPLHASPRSGNGHDSSWRQPSVHWQAVSSTSVRLAIFPVPTWVPPCPSSACQRHLPELASRPQGT